jgi:hypothetical protein
MGKRRGVYRVLVGRPDGQRQHGKPRRRGEGNIKIDFQEVGWECLDWIGLAQVADVCEREE